MSMREMRQCWYINLKTNQTMKLQDQVIPLPMAQRLKELGVKQESYFSWYVAKDVDDTPALNRSGFHCLLCGHPYAPYFEAVAAFTVAELGQLMPDYMVVDHYRMHFHSYKQEQYKKPALWTCTFGRSTDKEVPDFDRHNEAEARGTLLIHLLESNLITIQDINSRI